MPRLTQHLLSIGREHQPIGKTTMPKGPKHKGKLYEKYYGKPYEPKKIKEEQQELEEEKQPPNYDQ